MGAEIDELELKIKADAGKASSSIDKLAESMENLAKSLFVDTQKLSSIATGMRSISDAATGFKGGKSSEITSLNIALKKFNDVDTSSIYGISSAMKNLSAGMSSMQGVNADGVTNVANALSKLGGIKATTGADNLVKIKDDLARFVSGMNSVGTLNFNATGLTNLISGLSRMGGKASTQATKNLPTISAQLQNFVRQMNQIGSLKFEMSGLGELVTAISRLGSVASGRAVTNIPLLAKNLKELMETLSKAPAVSQNLIQMTNALANLAKTGSSSGRAANTLSKSLTGFSASAGSAKSSSLSLASAFGKLYASYWLIFRAFSKLKDAIDISSALTEVQNVVDTTFGNMAYKVDEFADNSIQQFGMSELAVKQYASRFQAMGTAMGINKSLISNANAALNKQTDGYIGLSDSLSDVSLNITKLTADMASFYDMEQSDVARNLQSIFTGETEPLRKYGLDLTQATLEEWAMKQGIDADMQSMSQAEKTMLRYQYVMANTTAAQGDFAKTADSWANQVRILKQSFEQLSSIVGGALINAFKPFLSALNVVMQKVIAFAETVTNALGTIFGWKFESRGSGVTDDWSDVAGSASDIEDSTGKAEKNIDKMNKGIRKFDELNLITTDSSSNGKGSGGAGGASGGGAGGGLVKTDTIFKDFESPIKDLYQLGEYIGDALTKAMNSIDWEKIYQGARDFGKGLADFLNGLISPELFGAVGRTIAGALNTAIYAALSFGEEFDWSDFGLSIATGINEFFRTFDFKSLAKTLNVWVDGLEDLIGTALKNLSWKDILKGCGDFFSNLEFDTVAVIIGALVLKKIGKVKIKEAVLGWLAEKLTSVFGGLTLKDFAITFASFLPKVQGTPFDVIIDWVLSGLDEAASKLLPDWFTEFWGNFIVGFSAAGTVSGGNPFAAVIGGLITSFPAEIDWDSIISFEWTKEWFEEAKKAFENAFNADDFMDIGGWILEGILDGFVGAFSFIFEPIARFFSEIFDGICEAFGIHSPAKEMKPIGNYILQGVLEGFVGAFINIPSTISKFFSNLWQALCSKFGINGSAQEMKPIGSSILHGIKNGFENATSAFGVTVSTFKNNLVNSFNGIRESFVGIGANIADGLSEGMNSRLGAVATTATNIGKNVSQSVRSTLGIHSPSRVMKELGIYTMQGFQNGLELLYQPITSSLEQFGTNLTEAPPVDISSMYGGYSPNQLETGGNTYSALDNNTYNRDNAETNALLRELITAVKQGSTIEVNGKTLGQTIRKEAKEYFSRTGNPMFEF